MEQLVNQRKSSALAQGAINQAKKNINNNWCKETRCSKKRSVSDTSVNNAIGVTEANKAKAFGPPRPVQSQAEFVCSTLCLLTLSENDEVIVLKGDERLPAIVYKNPFHRGSRSLTVATMDWCKMKKILCSVTEDDAIILWCLVYTEDPWLKVRPGRINSKPGDDSYLRLVVNKQRLTSISLRRFLASAPVEDIEFVNGFIEMLLTEVSGMM